MKNTIALFSTIASWTRAASFATVLFASTGFAGIAQTKVQSTQIVGEPTVIDEKVTIRVKVRGEGERPVVDLLDTDFYILVDDKEVAFKPRNWKSAKESTPPPAYIIILLDMSGSMRNPDAKGQRKLNGAVQAVQSILVALAERTKSAANVQVAIVPFGASGGLCKTGFPVNKETLDKFFTASDVKLKTYLETEIASVDPCASTNLYKSLQQTVRFLGDSGNIRFYPEDSKLPQPRLSVVLLSDGFDSEFFDKDKDAVEIEEFTKLQQLLKRNEQITVHTLGYGFTPAQLGGKYKLNRPATRKDIWSCFLFPSPNCKNNNPPAGKVPVDEFVDEQRLRDVAEATGGLSAFGADAKEVAEKLQVFLDAILGEYEITYDHPNPKRGKRHSVKVVAANVPSDSKLYRINVFGRTLPGDDRLKFLAGILVFCFATGGFALWSWQKSLKDDMV